MSVYGCSCDAVTLEYCHPEEQMKPRAQRGWGAGPESHSTRNGAVCAEGCFTQCTGLAVDTRGHPVPPETGHAGPTQRRQG